MAHARSGFLTLMAWCLAGSAGAAAASPAPGAGTLLVRAGDAELVPAPRLATEVEMRVAGVVARVQVTQRFRNTAGVPVEGVYLFPLPDEAAVDALTMRVGSRVVVGEIRERGQAERVYAEARDAGRSAGLLAQRRPNLFTTSVANIGPGERVEITIEYLQTARYDAGDFSLRFPMTLTPRYAPAGAGPGADAALPRAIGDAGPGAVAAHTEHEARLRVRLEPGLPLTAVGSRHHDVRVSRAGAAYVLETRRTVVPMDRDFVVTWRPEVGDVPALAAVAERREESTYVQLMILPPPATHEFASRPREVIFVVDSSGSMGGAPIEQARRALAHALGRLDGADRFNIFHFNSTTSSLYRTPVPLTRDTYAEALEYVEGLSADGGTEMAPAIRAALSQPGASGYVRQVVFLTDGGVANEIELFRLIRQHLGDARLFTIGIGSAPNSYFMRKAAQFGRGTYTHVGDVSEVQDRVTALLEKLERVALTDLVADWPAAAEYFPHRIPDLYAGEPVVLVGRLEHPLEEPPTVEVLGRLRGARFSRAVRVETGTQAGIASLWARRKIEHIVDAKVDGLGPDLIRALVVDVALEHGLVSPYTSLVAIDKTPAPTSAPAGTARVASMAPAGAAVASLPQTATPAPLLRLLGALLVALAAALALCGRRAGPAA